MASIDLTTFVAPADQQPSAYRVPAACHPSASADDTAPVTPAVRQPTAYTAPAVLAAYGLTLTHHHRALRVPRCSSAFDLYGFRFSGYKLRTNPRSRGHAARLDTPYTALSE